NLVPQSTVIARRLMLEKVGGYDASRPLAEDYDLWLRLSRSHPFVCTHKITASRRLHPARLTRDAEGMARAELEVKRQVWNDAAKRDTPEVLYRLEHVLLTGWNEKLEQAWRGRD